MFTFQSLIDKISIYAKKVAGSALFFLLTLKNIFFSGERTNVRNVKNPSLAQFTHLMAKISVKNIIWAKVKVVQNVGKKSLDIWFELTPLPFIQVS